MLELTKHGTKGVLTNKIDIPEDRLRLLISRGYFRCEPYGDGIFRITAEPSAIMYFEDRKDKRKEWVASNIVAILSLIVAVIALIRTF